MLFHILCDHSAAGTFQVVQLNDEEGRDYTFLIDPARHYCTFAEVREEVAGQLLVEPAEVELEEV